MHSIMQAVVCIFRNGLNIPAFVVVIVGKIGPDGVRRFHRGVRQADAFMVQIGLGYFSRSKSRISDGFPERIGIMDDWNA